jgi:hypothetical protein
MKEVYMSHNVGRRYVKRNYKDTLKALEDDGRIAASRHRKGCFPDRTVVTFPPREERERLHGPGIQDRVD